MKRWTVLSAMVLASLVLAACAAPATPAPAPAEPAVEPTAMPEAGPFDRRAGRFQRLVPDIGRGAAGDRTG